MSYLTLFSPLRSQPISRLLGRSHVIWDDWNGFDAIWNDPYHYRFEADESDTAYSFTLTLPGFKKNDVEIEVSEEAYLTVCATRGESHKVSRTITLPSDADTTKVEAKLEDGLLTLTIAKVIAAQPRKVTVN